MGGLRGWLDAEAAAVERPADEVAARVVAGVVLAVAARLEVRLPDLALLHGWGPPAAVRLPDAVVADPWLPGEALEALLAPDTRRRRGAHFTPRPLAAGVVDLALAACTTSAPTVHDQAVGGGAFLLAAAEALRRLGGSRRAAVGRLSGMDLDPLAVAVVEASLCLWAGGSAVPDVAVADALATALEDSDRPDVVVGNPPFLGQLSTATVRAPGTLRPWLDALAGPYTDTSSLFAAAAVHAVGPGGAVALVLPRSFLVSRDAGAARGATTADADLTHVWVPGGRRFAAAVDVCVPVWRRRDGTGTPPDVTRSAGLPPVAAPPAPPPPAGPGATWAGVLDGLDGAEPVPDLAGLRTDGVLGDRCSATAGFRDQFYGLVPFAVDDPDDRLDDATHARLVTSGMIDHATSAWGTRPARYAGRTFVAPRIDVGAVEAAGGPLARWLAGKRVPKLLVAAQTRTIEAVADPGGTWLPSTPVATVVPAPGEAWRVLVVLLSPVASAWAVQRLDGSGLSPGALRLPPSTLRALPVPADRRRWDEAADAVEAASCDVGPDERLSLLTSAARSSCHAYGLDPDPLVSWWLARHPRHPAPT